MPAAQDRRIELRSFRPASAAGSVRTAAVAALVALAGGFWLATFRWARRRPTASPPPERRQRCETCHPRESAEWRRSQHALSMTGVGMRTRLDMVPSPKDCIPCHAPNPVAVLQRTEQINARAQGRDSGVDCLACHARSDGVASRRTVAVAPCRPRATQGFGTPAFCGLCHVSIFGDWKNSPAAKQGRGCADCHLPRVARNGRPGRSHRFLGGHDEKLVQSAVAMDAEISSRGVLVRVRNRCLAHNMPGERHHRVLTLHYRRVDANGEIVEERRIVIKGVAPFQGESSSDNIKPGQTETYLFGRLGPGDRFDAWLKYKLCPWRLDVAARILGHVHAPK